MTGCDSCYIGGSGTVQESVIAHYLLHYLLRQFTAAVCVKANKAKRSLLLNSTRYPGKKQTDRTTVATTVAAAAA